MLEATLERMLADLTAPDDGAELERARAVFHERTGEFAAGDGCYEERIRCFFDWFLCEHALPDGSAPAARWMRTADSSAEEAAVARGLLASERSLFEVSAPGLLRDRIGGGRYRTVSPGVRVGDRLDGRLVPLGDELLLAPGIVFHPPQTHEALDALLEALGAPGDLDRPDVLDGMLRMRMRLDRFTSIRPRHIYRLEALDERDIMSAGWAKRPS